MAASETESGTASTQLAGINVRGNSDQNILLSQMRVGLQISIILVVLCYCTYLSPSAVGLLGAGLCFFPSSTSRSQNEEVGKASASPRSTTARGADLQQAKPRLVQCHRFLS